MDYFELNHIFPPLQAVSLKDNDSLKNTYVVVNFNDAYAIVLLPHSTVTTRCLLNPVDYFIAWISNFVIMVLYISHRQGSSEYWLVTSEPTGTDVHRHFRHNSQVLNLNTDQ